jgi:AbrB family looped-hinge helix DNA binding protein
LTNKRKCDIIVPEKQKGRCLEMMATGIVRRIDDFGRIAIPKELRRRMGLRENAPLKIFISEDGKIILQKYDTENASQKISKTP